MINICFLHSLCRTFHVFLCFSFISFVVLRMGHVLFEKGKKKKKIFIIGPCTIRKKKNSVVLIKLVDSTGLGTSRPFTNI